MNWGRVVEILGPFATRSNAMLGLLQLSCGL